MRVDDVKVPRAPQCEALHHTAGQESQHGGEVRNRELPPEENRGADDTHPAFETLASKPEGPRR